MDGKIDLDLFARLMQAPALARKDLLEYIGQGPVTLTGLLPEDDAADGAARDAAPPEGPGAAPGAPDLPEDGGHGSR